MTPHLQFDLRLRPEVPELGCLAGCDEGGIALLLDAVSGLTGPNSAPFHLRIHGDADQRDIIDRGLGPWISQWTMPRDLAAVIRHLDLVVIPSANEISALVSMEALCAGVPVLGPDCPGLRHVLCGTPSRTFRGGDADSLRHALQIALESPWTEAARVYAPIARQRFGVMMGMGTRRAA